MKELIQELINLEKEKALVEADIAAVKAKIEEGLKPGEGYKDDKITISYIKPSSSVSLDTKKLKEKEPGLYKELETDYPKITEKKGYYTYKITKEK